jgi:hypothetical protein
VASVKTRRGLEWTGNRKAARITDFLQIYGPLGTRSNRVSRLSDATPRHLLAVALILYITRSKALCLLGTFLPLQCCCTFLAPQSPSLLWIIRYGDRLSVEYGSKRKPCIMIHDVRHKDPSFMRSMRAASAPARGIRSCSTHGVIKGVLYHLGITQRRHCHSQARETTHNELRHCR